MVVDDLFSLLHAAVTGFDRVTVKDFSKFVCLFFFFLTFFLFSLKAQILE